MVVFDFTDCKTVEEVNAKWLEYAKDIEPWKSLFKKLQVLEQDREKRLGCFNVKDVEEKKRS